MSTFNWCKISEEDAEKLCFALPVASPDGTGTPATREIAVSASSLVENYGCDKSEVQRLLNEVARNRPGKDTPRRMKKLMRAVTDARRGERGEMTAVELEHEVGLFWSVG